MIEIVPFLFFFLVFLVVYGTLNKLRIFQRSINTIIATIIAFYGLLSYFLFSEATKRILAYAGVFMVFVFWVAIVYSLTKGEEKSKKDVLKNIFVAFLFLAILLLATWLLISI